MSNESDYWKECIASAADECDLKLTEEQLDCIASAAELGHSQYGLAFYEPSWGERFDDIRTESERKLKDLQNKLDSYKENAELAVKIALRQQFDSNISIGQHGEVFRNGGGHTVQIQ